MATPTLPPELADYARVLAEMRKYMAKAQNDESLVHAVEDGEVDAFPALAKVARARTKGKSKKQAEKILEKDFEALSAWAEPHQDDPAMGLLWGITLQFSVSGVAGLLEDPEPPTGPPYRIEGELPKGAKRLKVDPRYGDLYFKIKGGHSILVSHAPALQVQQTIEYMQNRVPRQETSYEEYVEKARQMGASEQPEAITRANWEMWRMDEQMENATTWEKILLGGVEVLKSRSERLKSERWPYYKSVDYVWQTPEGWLKTSMFANKPFDETVLEAIIPSCTLTHLGSECVWCKK